MLAPRGADTGTLSARLGASLAAAGLPDPEVSVDVVTDLPRDGRSGKLRRFVPVY